MKTPNTTWLNAAAVGTRAKYPIKSRKINFLIEQTQLEKSIYMDNLHEQKVEFA